MIYTQGLKIYCAMDTKAQSIAESTLKDSSVMPKDQNLELGYTMMDFNGRILATLGSRKQKTGNLLYDRANVAKQLKIGPKTGTKVTKEKLRFNGL